MKLMMGCLGFLMMLFTLDLPLAAQAASGTYATQRLCFGWDKSAPGNEVLADHFNIACGTAPGLRDLPVKPLAISPQTLVPAQPPNPAGYCIYLRDLFPAPTTFPANRVCAARAAAPGIPDSAEGPEFFFTVTGSKIAAPTGGWLLP